MEYHDENWTRDSGLVLIGAQKPDNFSSETLRSELYYIVST